jgi:FkbM family methyltransferase
MFTFSAYQTYIWGHDIALYPYGGNLSVEGILNKWRAQITGCVCQTEWHANLFSQQYPQLTNKIQTINNGIKSELFTFIEQKKPNRFLYSSCSERGLRTLLELWPQILNNLPDAELYICSYNDFPKNEDEIKMLKIIQENPNTITHLGKLSQIKLYELMSSVEYWLYPSYFTETSCITSLEMLASEVICLYYPVAGLVNTLGNYGVPIAQGNEINMILSLNEERKNELRKNGKEYALSCSWKNRAQLWNDNVIVPSHVENRLFELYETISMPAAHIRILKTISETFTPQVIYDIGASTLHWTKEALKIWPKSEIVAFDAIKEASKLYQSKNIKYNIGVLSDTDHKIVHFYENKENPAGNSYYKEIGHPNSLNIYPEDSYSEQNSMTLETTVRERKFPLPDLVKIDVQGAELDILKGGINIINNAKYLIIELQSVEYNRGAPLENVTIEYLNSNGWSIVESKFSNNGPDADYLFINNKYLQKIAIFNSFPFHYEMFGYILNYAQNNNYLVDVYTNSTNDLGWIDFYKNYFKNTVTFFDFKEYSNIKLYKHVFVTTDDDHEFKTEWITDNVICINHYYKIRNPNFKHYINVANFKDSNIDYAISCYPIIDASQKITNNTVTIVGGATFAKWNYNTINRLTSKNNIVLNIITRNPELVDLNQINSNFTVNLFGNVNTNKMVDILTNTTYILSNYNDNMYHNLALGSSGSTALSFSTLCKLIIDKTTNSWFKIQNAIEFDIETSDPIDIDTNVDFNELHNERNIHIEKFEKHMKNINYFFKYDNICVNLRQSDNIKDVYKNYYERANCEPMFRSLICYLWELFIDKNIIDLGAWIGDNTIPWAIKSNGIIYAIDPSSENIDNIKQLALLNNVNNVVTMEHAISDCVEQVYSNEDDLTHISCNTNFGIHKLETTTLDLLNFENIGFIHLDVEGFEQKVLNGSTKLLLKYKPIIVWENHICQDNYTFTVNFLKELGYETYMINELFPHCFPDCRNFISFTDSVLNINSINNHFKDIYGFFAADKKKEFLIKMTTDIIPKKIIQTWEHKDLTPEFQEIVNTWKTNNPNYEYILFDKNEREQFIKDNFDISVYNVYKSIVPGANKADLFRYCYLYICGGVYVDIDSLCIGKLDDFLLQNIDLVLLVDFNTNPTEGTHNLACGFIASVPKHGALLNCINKIVYNVENNIILPSRLDFTGPGILGRAVNQYLNNSETDSFIGKEGILDGIHFLKFEPVTEYVKDTNNRILFQNKNGNPEIIHLYNIECYKLQNFVSWVNCPNNLLINKHPNSKEIALTIYGQFRNYDANLEKNINMLEPLFKQHSIHIFILTDRLVSGNYSKANEYDITNIFHKFNLNNIHFYYIEDYDISEENTCFASFFGSIKHEKGIGNEFVPRLMYRKYLLNKIKNEYITKHNLNIDLHVFCRLFDVNIQNNLDFTIIENEINNLYKNKQYLLGSADTFFIGSNEGIDHIFSITNNIKSGKLYHDDIWNNIDFCEFYCSFDICLYNLKHTYAPEVQYVAHVFFSEYKYKNIRVDFNNLSSKYNNTALYHIHLDPNRYSKCNNNKTQYNLTRGFINFANSNMPNDFLNYYTSQGLIDYNNGIGQEHYKLLSSLSQQINNGIIIDIGTHIGNSAVSFGYSLFKNMNNTIYSFDIMKLAQPSCQNFFEKYSIKYNLENIFDKNIRNKYKTILLSSKLIMIDIDPHDGVLEYEMLEWLKENNYDGIILFDDIFLQKGHNANNYKETTHDMIEFWNKIPNENKINLTHVGHWSGTGLVCFHFDKYQFILD